MRSDQYIGLTKKGHAIITKLYDDGNYTKKVDIGDWAFDDGKIQGFEITTEDRIYREEIQDTPWSSGPMFFTRIGIFNKKTGNKIGTVGDWIFDEESSKEYVDYETGKYCVWNDFWRGI